MVGSAGRLRRHPGRRARDCGPIGRVFELGWRDFPRVLARRTPAAMPSTRRLLIEEEECETLSIR